MEGFKQATEKNRRNKNKTTIDSLPALTVDRKATVEGRSSKFKERRVTIGANSDQKDSVGIKLQNVSEALSMFNLRNK